MSEEGSELAKMRCCSLRSLALISCCKRDIRGVICRCERESTAICTPICIVVSVMFDV